MYMQYLVIGIGRLVCNSLRIIIEHGIISWSIDDIVSFSHEHEHGPKHFNIKNMQNDSNRCKSAQISDAHTIYESNKPRNAVSDDDDDDGANK